MRARNDDRWRRLSLKTRPKTAWPTSLPPPESRRDSQPEAAEGSIGASSTCHDANDASVFTMLPGLGPHLDPWSVSRIGAGTAPAIRRSLRSARCRADLSMDHFLWRQVNTDAGLTHDSPSSPVGTARRGTTITLKRIPEPSSWRLPPGRSFHESLQRARWAAGRRSTPRACLRHHRRRPGSMRCDA